MRIQRALRMGNNALGTTMRHHDFRILRRFTNSIFIVRLLDKKYTPMGYIYVSEVWPGTGAPMLVLRLRKLSYLVEL